MIVWVYISTTTHKDIYKGTLEDIYKEAAVAQGKGAQLVILGDINVDLHGISNPRMDLLHGTFVGQDEHRDLLCLQHGHKSYPIGFNEFQGAQLTIRWSMLISPMGT